MFNVYEYWGPTNTRFSGTNTNISKRKNISSPSHLIICCFYPWGSWGCYCFIPLFSKGSRGVTGYWSQSQLSLWVKAGYTLNESPAYCRALTDGRGQHARCQLHIRSNFGVQHLGQRYFNMQLSSTPEEGLPAKLQLPHAQKKKQKKTYSYQYVGKYSYIHTILIAVILKMCLLFCPKVHQSTDPVDFTGNLMIINYPKCRFPALFSNQYISQAFIQKHKIVNVLFKCPNNVHKTWIILARAVWYHLKLRLWYF